MSKIPFRALFLSTLVVILGSPSFGSTAFAATTLNVGKADANASPILPVNVGEKAGIFARHGLDVEIADFTGGSKLVQAMTAGSIDIGVAAGPLMALEIKGAPMLGVCDDAPPIPFIGIAVPWDSPIHSLDQLKGKKIGISSFRFVDRLAGAGTCAGARLGTARRHSGRDRQRSHRRHRGVPY